jgi:hypothetical protein
MLPGAAPLRCREVIQPGVAAAMQRAEREVMALALARGGGGGGGEGEGAPPPPVVCVTGSLHAVAAATRELERQEAEA